MCYTLFDDCELELVSITHILPSNLVISSTYHALVKFTSSKVNLKAILIHFIDIEARNTESRLISKNLMVISYELFTITTYN